MHEICKESTPIFDKIHHN